MSTNDSIEYPGYFVTQHENADKIHTADFFNQVKEQYKDVEVLHILSYHTSGLDWFHMEKIGKEKYGFEVIWRPHEQQ